MLSEKMNQALNDQVKWEMFSSYLYLSMSAYFADKGMGGFAQWMRAQAQEELFHATKFYDYINERGGRVILQPIEAPDNDWANTLEVFEETLKHEQLVTSRINDLVNLAIDERDHATNIFLQWFVSEQVEEEDSVNDVLGKLKMIGGEGQGMLMLDSELGQRVFTPPVAK
ncbi:ferritin [Halodesulfovibrio marinisediminis]|uniref:Ferritin n=1 Tax=Halodesulfovibrio marinisediminis DSM 17456 TaxID=1121457 RepID=A0A1N6J7Z8_9BACT|nr:ferritin [Halodesulfovibrio marinisediminis]SIO40474.1 ferritin [Halodesulfovibrio marinisediminis DSM 17456]